MISFLRNTFIKTTLILIASFAFFASQKVVAQVRFSAICPQTKIGENDLLQIQFKLENAHNVESIIPPVFKDFKIVSGPNQQSGMTSYNGKIDQYLAISFFLQPLSTGRFTIESAIAKADGKKFSSDPVAIEVVKGNVPSGGNRPPSSPSPFSGFSLDLPRRPNYEFDDYILKDGENVEDKIKDNLFIKLDVSKKECYVGEAITASYKLFTRLRSESTITSAPSFNGFSVSDLDVTEKVQIEKHKGRPYNVYTLRKVQLYPMQDGNVLLDPLIADNKVTFLKGDYAGRYRGDLFFDMLENFADAASPESAVIDKMITLKSEPVTIHVKPLPAKNIPAGYKGAVGNYSIEAKISNNKMTTDDEGLLEVTLSGEGNIQMVNAPEINWPQGLDGFDARVKETVNKFSVPISGNKIFSFPFIADKAGEYQIDSIEFSFFDPESESYRVVKTKSFTLHVEKGKGNIVSQLVKDQQQKNAPAKSFFQDNPLLMIITGSGILLLIAILFYRNKKQKEQLIPDKNKAIKSEINQIPNKEFIIPENPLLAAHEKLMKGDSAGFYRTLDVSLKNYLAAKFNIPIEEISKKRLYEELDRCNVGLSTSLMLTKLQEDIELNLYARPASQNELKAVFEKASEVISLLDKQVCN